jgi:hypothetical protein
MFVRFFHFTSVASDQRFDVECVLTPTTVCRKLLIGQRLCSSKILRRNGEE